MTRLSKFNPGKRDSELYLAVLVQKWKKGEREHQECRNCVLLYVVENAFLSSAPLFYGWHPTLTPTHVAAKHNAPLCSAALCADRMLPRPLLQHCWYPLASCLSLSPLFYRPFFLLPTPLTSTLKRTHLCIEFFLLFLFLVTDVNSDWPLQCLLVCDIFRVAHAHADLLHCRPLTFQFKLPLFLVPQGVPFFFLSHLRGTPHDIYSYFGHVKWEVEREKQKTSNRANLV